MPTIRYETDSIGIIVAIDPKDSPQSWQVDVVVPDGDVTLPKGSKVTVDSSLVVTDAVKSDLRFDATLGIVRAANHTEQVDANEWKQAVSRAEGDLNQLMGGNFLIWFSQVTGIKSEVAQRALAVLYRGEVRLT